jgi:hypothetical protein
MLHEFGLGRSAELAMAVHAADALERYERLMLDLVARGGGADLHRRATEEIEAIRKDCVEFPSLSVTVAELSISHAEVIFAMLKADLLGEVGRRRLCDTVQRNQAVSERLRALVAHIMSTRSARARRLFS